MKHESLWYALLNPLIATQKTDDFDFKMRVYGMKHENFC